MMRSLLLYSLLIFGCISCNKGGTAADEIHEIDASDDTYPVVTVNTPADNQVFTSGSIISVTGKVSDNSLFQGSISIRNDSNGLVIKDQYYEIHYIPSYDFTMSCPVSVTTATTYTVTIKFEDHGFNNTIKTLKITVNP